MAAPVSSPTMMISEDPNAVHLSGQVSNARADLLNAGANNTSAVLQRGSADTQTLLQTACADTASVIGSTERQSYHTQSAVDRSGKAQAEVNSAGFFESRALNNSGAAENRETTNINHVESRSLQNSNFFEVRNSLNNGFTASLLASKDSQLAIALSEGKIRNDLSNISGLLSGQIATSKECIVGLVGNLHLQNQVELGKYFAIAERENSKQFALATVAASTNAATIESKLAECCCEIKEAVVSSANDTQALVQASETNRVRDELAVTQQNNLVLQINPVA